MGVLERTCSTLIWNVDERVQQFHWPKVYQFIEGHFYSVNITVLHIVVVFKFGDCDSKFAAVELSSVWWNSWLYLKGKFLWFHSLRHRLFESFQFWPTVCCSVLNDYSIYFLQFVSKPTCTKQKRERTNILETANFQIHRNTTNLFVLFLRSAMNLNDRKLRRSTVMKVPQGKPYYHLIKIWLVCTLVPTRSSQNSETDRYQLKVIRNREWAW